MSKAMSLKAKIRNIAKQKNIPAQVILQNYMFERLLVRLSVSEYKEKFVLKGGMLVAAIVGLDNRATMDMDTTLKNLPLTPEAVRSALEEICTPDASEQQIRLRIYAIVDSLSELDGIDEVSFLLDGEPIEGWQSVYSVRYEF